MRTACAMLCVFLIAPGARLLAGQHDQKPKLPTKGAEIVVKGCLRGTLLEDAETRAPDEEGELRSAPRYQLKGDKRLVKQLRDEYDDHFIEVVGILQSKIVPADTVHGKQLGRSRITIGVASGTRRDPVPPSPALPVLEVLSFRSLATSCTR